MPKLILHPNSPRMQEFVLKEGANFLGRDAENDVTIEDPSVSGSHAQITVTGPVVSVTDLGSSNGTFIDREPVTEALLQSGQLLRLGGVEMLFDATAEEPSETEAAEIQVETPASSPARLRIASAEPAAVQSPPSATAVGAPPVAPRIPITPTPDTGSKKSVCRFHPKAVARWQCPQCRQMYCDLCINRRRSGHGVGSFCRPCGKECAPVAAPVSLLPEVSDTNFYSQLPGAFAYPFTSGVGFVLVCTAGFFALASLLRFFFWFVGGSMWLFSLGYVFVYMKNIITYTALGENREPPIPDVMNIAEDIIMPALQLLGTIILCFGPAIALGIWSLAGGPEWARWAIIPALGLGCIYFPMAFLTMAMFDSIGAINPMVVIPAIAKIPLEYLTACVLLGVVFAVRWFGAMLLAYIMPIPIVPGLISSVIGLYFLAVQCRVLGLLYYTNRYQFGWMRH